MSWLIVIFSMIVVLILYLLPRYVNQEGFQNAGDIDKLSACPVLEKHINSHRSNNETLQEEKAVHTLHVNKGFLDAYEKKYNELGCATLRTPPT